MWHSHLFIQRNKTTERAMWLGGGSDREGWGRVGQSLKKGGVGNIGVFIKQEGQNPSANYALGKKNNLISHNKEINLLKIRMTTGKIFIKMSTLKRIKTISVIFGILSNK